MHIFEIETLSSSVLALIDDDVDDDDDDVVSARVNSEPSKFC